MITKHQKLHLDAVIKDAKNQKAVDDARDIIASGNFPNIDPSDIHDYLEKS